MAEEPDAGGHSSDDESVEDAGAEESPDGGDEPAEREGGSVDSEVEPQVEPEFSGGSSEEAESEGQDASGERDGTADEDGGSAEGDDGNTGEDADGRADESDSGPVAGGDDEASPEDGEEQQGPDDGSPAIDDDARPLGAVTDASSPPAESAPGVDGSDSDGDGADEGVDGESAVDDADDANDTAGDDTAEDDTAEDDTAGVAPESDDGAVGLQRPGEPASDEADDEADDGAESAASTAPKPGPAPAGDADELADQPPEGPPDDEEMPLADHIEEMVLRLAVVCAVAAVVAGTVFFFEPLAEDTILFIWQSVIPHHEMKVHPLVGGTTHPGHYIQADAVGSTNPRVYGPLELKLTELKFASLVGFVLALPVFVYETYRFMRPGLYPNERRYYLAAVPTSLVLAFVGVAFSYFIILPAIFAYFVRYSERAGVLAFALRQTFDLILVLMGYMALVFQIPLFIMLAIMMGLTDRLWLEARRLYFWGGFLGVSFLFVPEPTGMAPILVALTMVGLFEGTLALLRWTGN